MTADDDDGNYVEPAEEREPASQEALGLSRLLTFGKGNLETLRRWNIPLPEQTPKKQSNDEASQKSEPLSTEMADSLGSLLQLAKRDLGIQSASSTSAPTRMAAF